MPAGLQWPDTGEQVKRTEEALTIITRLLDGATVDFEGRWFRARGARLYTQLERRPPIYMSAFYEQAVEIAGRLADGVWTLADPQKAPRVIAAYRRGCEQAGREPGQIILQGLFSWAESDEQALACSREWKGTLVDENYTDAVADPAEVGRNGAEASDTKFKAMAIVSADASAHVRRIKLMQQLGPKAIALMNISGAGPLGAVRFYGDQVLPQLPG